MADLMHRRPEGSVADWLIRRLIPIVLVVVAAACFEHPRNPINRALKQAIGFLESNVQQSSPLAP